MNRDHVRGGLPARGLAVVRRPAGVVIAALLASMAPLVLVACEQQQKSGHLCDQICECTGCSEAEHAECVDGYGDLASNAEAEGCTARLDRWLDCLAEETQCLDGVVDSDGCEALANELAVCGGTTTVPDAQSRCKVASATVAEKVEACGLELPDDGAPGAEVECTDDLAAQIECMAECYDDVSCGVLRGTSSGHDELTEYGDCLTACIPEEPPPPPSCAQLKVSFEDEYAACVLDASLDGLSCPEDQARAECMFVCIDDATCEEKLCLLDPGYCEKYGISTHALSCFEGC